MLQRDNIDILRLHTESIPDTTRANKKQRDKQNGEKSYLFKYSCNYLLL